MFELELKSYYKLINTNTKEETIVYFYHNEDADCDGFGFNTADGGGFLPLDHLAESTIVKKLQIIEE